MKTRGQELSGVVGRVTPCAPVFADRHHKKTARRGLTRPTQSGRMARSVLECGGPPPLGYYGSSRRQEAHSMLAAGCWIFSLSLVTSAATTWIKSARGLAQSKTWRMALAFYFLLSAFSFRASGQSYSIDWYKIAGGGGTSTGGTYSVTGTIGQHDAGGPMTGGNYSLTGGFWALISVVQTPGLPNLIITFVGPNSVLVSWPNTGSYTLQQNSNLAGGSWTTSGYSITTSNGTNSITVNPPTGNLFFRLAK